MQKVPQITTVKDAILAPLATLAFTCGTGYLSYQQYYNKAQTSLSNNALDRFFEEHVNNYLFPAGLLASLAMFVASCVRSYEFFTSQNASDKPHRQ
jgi:hypothetical protein